jgi:hypothetical protein
VSHRDGPDDAAGTDDVEGTDHDEPVVRPVGRPAGRALRLPVGGGLRARLGRHPDLDELAADLEPWAIPVSGALREHRRFGTRITVSIEDADGGLLGALVLDRLAVTQWAALPLVSDPRCAPVIARLVDRSWAAAVDGTSRHVDPVLAHLRRAKGGGRAPFYGIPPDEAFLPGEADERCRAATPADIPAILDLFDAYPFERLPSRRSRRRALEAVMAERMGVVVEADGAVVGAMLTDAHGREWMNASDGMVDDAHRGQGFSWAFVNRMMTQTMLVGLGLTGSQHRTNRMGTLEKVRAAGGDAEGRPTDELCFVAMQERRWLGPPRWRRRQVRRVHGWLDRFDELRLADRAREWQQARRSV